MIKLNIYAVEFSGNIKWDMYAGLIVVAANEEEVTTFVNEHVDSSFDWSNYYTRLIGKAAKGVECGVLLSSYMYG